ncbi:MAG: PD-(D/E)XK nuclease family protein [Bacteroidales bacterium]|nr:PD-(D/E)XK nuclease family protein [Bacteroidales bacterium]
MVNGFLWQVAKLYLEREGDAIAECCFVFPNRRSSLFFKKYLGEMIDKPLFSPALITINNLFSEISGLKVADKISLLIDLYKEYNISSFDEFVFWGDILLNDFDDIDKYMVDAEKLFTNIKDLHELDGGYEFLSQEQIKAIKSFWRTFNEYSAGTKEQQFLSLWNNLYRIYSNFRSHLESKGEAYEGLIYRMVADAANSAMGLPQPTENGETDEGVIALQKLAKRYKKIVFVGLNALNECEKRLLSYLKREGVADFYWDFYGDEITDSANKSSLFMKENILQYPSAYPLPDGQTGRDLTERKIEVIGVPSAVGQAKYLTGLLPQLDPVEISIVLPDENLLFPVLNSIPEEIQDVNVTMGYSLKNSQVASFMGMLAPLWKKAKEVDGETQFYHASVIALLGHKYIQGLEGVGERAKRLKREIVEKNMIFVPAEILAGDDIIGLIFRQRPEQMADYQIALLEELQKGLNPLDKELVLGYFKCINRLKGFNLDIKDETYFKLLGQLVSGISIPFNGEPLSGLQIMGPLETRALDFENVVILSCNEGKFPSKSVSNSFIPYNLRKGFGLPNYEFQDSIWAYHFYRSIYRARKVYLLYDTRTEGVGRSGEVSRYVKQLKYHHGVEMRERVVSFKIESSPETKVAVQKSDDVIKRLFEHNFSASSVNTYLDCPLKFYLQAVEKIKEEEEVSEQVEANVFGTMFHEVMQHIYEPYCGEIVSEDILSHWIDDEKSIMGFIHDAFRKEMKVSRVEGKNKIVEALILRYVKRTLEQDRRRAPFVFTSVEERCPVMVKLPSLEGEVKFFGIIDRRDGIDGNDRIVDYKTGGYSIKWKEVGDMFDLPADKRPYTAFQMMLYLFLLDKKGLVKDMDKVVLSVCSLRDLFSTDKSVTEFAITPQDYELFVERLYDLIENQIFNKEIPFEAKGEGKTCEYCPYSVVCNK